MTSSPRPQLTADQLVGLLAEEHRLRAVSALVLGATSAQEVADRAGLDLREAVAALERLAGGGLVEQDGDGRLGVVVQRFKDAARRRPVEPQEDFDVAPEAAAVLRNFVRDGRLLQIPSSRGKRLVVLDWLVARFDPGKTYPERDVNLMVGMAHADVAALRRYLVDEGMLERRDGFYWRAGGTFEVD
ncbi:MAG: hypothetical protein AVDCRST_MAG50-3298 [uncultured Acidimicrobiales bacterium]|uniref:DUF2087 domain-containing protein n=1 Tax=uncultured Acidimicrobiales bacterium TaxID=310071 RepID=A0A6J4J8V1_9ACTN|nr:MAG: hypothetical protein AVDCRST_MAG50-3298 [uncultured Acidimicrobiales bacterium]